MPARVDTANVGLASDRLRLTIALALSVAAHAAAGTLVPPPSARIAPLDRALDVWLVPKPLPQPVAVASLEAARPAAAAPVAPRPHRLLPAPVVVTRHVEAKAPRQPEAETRTAPPPVQIAETAAPQVAALTPDPAREVVSTAPPSPELLAGYGRSISELLGRYRSYPRIAQMRGWEGSVTMRLTVAPGGKLVEAKVEASSGHDVLDDEAMKMVGKVASLPSPPEGLRDREFAVRVPVVFRLR
jgi:protein TonB